jgi:predicted DNA-binding ribbon-helix-helix protein
MPELNESSPVTKRSIVIAGHKTSISLEDAFWNGLREIASTKTMTLSALVASIDQGRQHNNLSSCIRLFILEHYQARSDTCASGGDNVPQLNATAEPVEIRHQGCER